ncbi:MAG: hypothetical protein ACE5KH_02955, partial [Candidatus Geothermarchaeales archaeon]
MRRSHLLDLSVTLLVAPFGLAGSLLIYATLFSQVADDGLAQAFLIVSKNPFLFVVSIVLTLTGTAIFVRAHDAPTYRETLTTASSLVISLGGASAILAYLVALFFSGNLGTAGQLMVEGRFFSVYPLVLFVEGLLLRVGGRQALKFKS